MSDGCCSRKGEGIAELGRKAERRRVLVIVMAITLIMFIAEFGGGLVARSSALMADSVNMLADTVVYALSLWIPVTSTLKTFASVRHPINGLDLKLLLKRSLARSQAAT